MEALAEITQDLATPEICWHLHVYDAGGVVLECYDAFDLPLSVSKRLALPDFEALCARVGAPDGGRGRS